MASHTKRQHRHNNRFENAHTIKAEGTEFMSTLSVYIQTEWGWFPSNRINEHKSIATCTHKAIQSMHVHIYYYIQHSSHTHNTWKWCQIKIESLFIFFLSFFPSFRSFVRFGRSVVSSFENYVSIASKIPSAHTIWRMVFVSVLLLSLVELHFTSLHTHTHTCIHTETPIHSDARTHARSFNHSLIHSRMHAHIPQIHGKVKPKFMHSYKSIPLACLLAYLLHSYSRVTAEKCIWLGNRMMLNDTTIRLCICVCNMQLISSSSKIFI